MSAKTLSRKVHIYINGKEIESTIGSLLGCMERLKAQQKAMTIGSEEYIETSLKIKEIKSVLEDQRRAIQSAAKDWDAVREKAAQYGGVIAGFRNIMSMLGTSLGGLQDLAADAAAVLLLAGMATFFMLHNNGSSPDRQTIVAQNQIDTTAPQQLQDTTQNTETPEQQLPSPTPVRNAVQRSKTQQIANNTTPVSESDYKNETTQPSPLLAENTDSTMQDNDNQNFIQYIETPTKVVYTDQIITYSQYAPVEEPAIKPDRMEMFLRNFDPVQTIKDMKNDIASIMEYLSDGAESIKSFFSPSRNRQTK